MAWFASLSTHETTAETAPWLEIPDLTTGIAAFINTDTQRVLSMMLDTQRRLLVAYTGYEAGPNGVEWHQFGHFNDDGTVEIYEPVALPEPA